MPRMSGFIEKINMYKHHEESIENMIQHYKENKEIKALFLIGSVATDTARMDSDIDGVAVVSQKYFEEKKKTNEECESIFGKCTYQGGYFDVHFISRKGMEELAEKGSEPMRNRFTNARALYCDEPGLPELTAKIAVFQKQDAVAKQLRYYCAFRQYHSYYWKCCKPEGFMKHHTANAMVFNLYRLILLENEILFPSVRKLEEFVKNAPNKPDNIIEKCQRFQASLNDDDASELIKSYESWTTYNYPKEFQFIANNFMEPWEWD
jgi:predicted nucleotidyltransferase